MPPFRESVQFPAHFGFCEGVVAADDLLKNVSTVAHEHGVDTVYGLHGIVHNSEVIASHEAQGVIFVEDPAEIPEDQLVVTSAHGTAPQVQHALEQKGSTTFDAACPLVLATHRSVARARNQRETVLYVCHGKPGEATKLHDEVQAMVGHLDYTLTDSKLKNSPVPRAYLELGEEPTTELLHPRQKYRIIGQTTLLASGLLKYRDILTDFITAQQPEATVKVSEYGDVCFAVQNRQEGVRQLVNIRPRRVDQIVVVTDPTSANGQSYVDLARELTEGQETTVHAVANAEEAAALGPIDGLTGLTASASTPDSTTLEVARVFGLNTDVMPERRKFRLQDARKGVIEEKIRRHIERTRGNNG